MAINPSRYDFDRNDTAARQQARERFLRDALKQVRTVHTALRKVEIEELVTDLLLLQPALMFFSRVDRGWPLPDRDMATNVVGPIGALVHAFDNLGSLNLTKVEELLSECEQKVERALDREQLKVRSATR